MEDVFYFTKLDVKLKDVADMAEKGGLRSEFIEDATGTNLNIYAGVYFSTSHSADNHPVIQREEFWQWWQYEKDDSLVQLETANRKKLDAYAPTSCFMISYHPSSLPQLRTFLMSITTAFGGWVGCDDDWSVIYDADNLEFLDCYPQV